MWLGEGEINIQARAISILEALWESLFYLNLMYIVVVNSSLLEDSSLLYIYYNVKYYLSIQMLMDFALFPVFAASINNAMSIILSLILGSSMQVL